MQLTPVFRDVPAMRWAGIMRRYSMESRREIPQLWGQFAPHIGQIPSQVGRRSYGISVLVSGTDCDFDYMAAVEVHASAEIPAGMTEFAIPPQKFAVLLHTGHVSELPGFIDAIYRQWLPTSGLRTAPGPCIECYTEEFCGEKMIGGMEIWVPIVS